jgi:hypothetical protein
MSSQVDALLTRVRQYTTLCAETCLYFRVPPVRSLIMLMSIGVFMLQLSQLIYYIAHASDSFAVINAFDNDGANAINVTQRSYWITSNGFYAYGSLYFRISHTLEALMTPPAQPGDIAGAEAQTKAVHFALLLTSVISLTAIGALVAWVWFGFSQATWILGTLCVWVLISSSTWQEFLLRPHPDYLLASGIGFAGLATFYLWLNPENKYRQRVSAWAWGLALAIKMSVILYLPFVFLTVFLPWRSRMQARVLTYIGHMSAAYFFVGFPQSLNIPKTIKFLIYQSGYSDPPSKESLLDWVNIYGEQIVKPLGLLVALTLALALLAERRGWSMAGPSLLWKAILLGAGPYTLNMTQKVLPPHAHYAIPVVTVQLILLSLYLTHRWEALSNINWRQKALVCLSVLLWFALKGVVPESLNQRLAAQLHCRPEAREVHKRLADFFNQGLRLFSDPYMPALPKHDRSRSSWRANKALIKEGDFDVIGLKDEFYSSYLDDGAIRYVSTYNKDWYLSREFYKLFAGQERVEDPEIGRWNRVYKDVCGFEIWLRRRAEGASAK